MVENLLQSSVIVFPGHKASEVGRITANMQRPLVGIWNTTDLFVKVQPDHLIENFELPGHHELKAPAYSFELHVVSNEILSIERGPRGIPLPEMKEAVIGHARIRTLLEHEGQGNKIVEVSSAAPWPQVSVYVPLPVGCNITIPVNRNSSAINLLVRHVVSIEVKPGIVNGPDPDRVKDLEVDIEIIPEQLEASIHPGAFLQGLVPVIEEPVYRDPLSGLAFSPRAQINTGVKSRTGKKLEIDLTRGRHLREVINAVQGRSVSVRYIKKTAEIKVERQVEIDFRGFQEEAQSQDVSLHPDLEGIRLCLDLDPEGIHHDPDELLDVVLWIKNHPLNLINGIINLQDKLNEFAGADINPRNPEVLGLLVNWRVRIGHPEGQLIKGAPHVIAGLKHGGEEILQPEILVNEKDSRQVTQFVSYVITLGLRLRKIFDLEANLCSMRYRDASDPAVDLDSPQGGRCVPFDGDLLGMFDGSGNEII